MQVFEVLHAKGHRNITAKHRTTFELTKDVDISRRADCIIGVEVSKAAADLSQEFKNLAKRNDAEITIDIYVEELHERIRGRGSEKLSFTDSRSLVVRRSNYSCGRTLMVQADKAAIDLNRALVEKLKLGAKIIVQLAVNF
ncbi:MAG: DUF371 domain-containing protein [Methanocellales archaeon]